MSDPNDFLSFADYLGLNDEAGQSMLNKTLAGEQGTLDNVQKYSDAHLASAGEAGSGQDVGHGRDNPSVYDKTGQGIQQGLASYGDFLKGMNDPAARQASLEKAYGKGAVSWLDSAVTSTAGGGRLAQAGQDFSKFSGEVEQQSANADQRKSDVARMTASYAADKERNTKDRQSRYDAQAAQDAGWKNATREAWTLGKRAGTYGPMQEREMRMHINQQAKKYGVIQGNGDVDWNAYNAKEADRRSHLGDAPSGTF